MAREALFVALAGDRYRVERPWGDIPIGRALVSDVACDARDHVFVLLRHDAYLDPDLPAVIELAPDGRRIAGWGGADIADGHMLACAPDGLLHVVDRDAHQIVVFDRTGRRFGALGGRHGPGAPFSHPSGVAIAPSGDIFVSDGYGACRVHRFAAGGGHLATWGSPGRGAGQFSTPHGIWATSERVLVTDRENDRVQAFSPAGEFLAEWHGFGRPMDICTDPAGRIFVTDQVPRLHLLAPDGTSLDMCRPVLNGGHGVWRDSAGRIYLAELSPSRLTRLVPEPR
jgi:DNA-binding beta-propeller fold protein YncE